MNISSNTLFHFSNSWDSLLKIVRGGFEPRFCLEEFGPEILFSSLYREEIALPMVCFCDLPLSKINIHMDSYGKFGIGLTKDWGKRKGLTPITYIHENSTQIKYLRLIGKHLSNLENFKSYSDEENPTLALLELSSYYKPYDGKMWRNNTYVDKRFYDEREWRYVPFLADLPIYRLTKEDFLDGSNLRKSNGILAEKFKLEFDSSDIRYIILEDRTQVNPFCESLDRMLGVYTKAQIDYLKTKIISSDDILSDF